MNTMAEKQKIVMPGEIITTEEEYVPKRNTFAQNGIVKAKVMGKVEFDDANKEVRVAGKSIKELRAGDIVVGKITLVKESTAVIELVSAEGGKKITGMKTAQLPVRNISTEYISDIKKIMKIGDIIRARIMMASRLAIDLATNEKGLGVTKAYCSKCRQEMKYSNEKLMCLNCGNVEERKWFEAEQKPREFAPRGDFGDRNRGPRREGGFGGGFRPRGDFGGNRERTPRREGPSFGGHHNTSGVANREDKFSGNAERGNHAGRDSRKQGQGFSGHQNRPQQRW
ncbi:MAG: exosome complex RNA-binding protein Csl4 [archaeon]|jgi:exosome complex RNA-binding protein Csl4